MPPLFRHQTYRSEPPISQYRLLPAASPSDPQSASFTRRLAQSGAAYSRAGVAAIYCVHGTFAGTDTLGLLLELSRYAPGLSRRLGRGGKRTFDWMMGETGNYTRHFADALQDGLTAGAGRQLPVRRFHWSGQNNHIARADGAIRFLHELAGQAKILCATTDENCRTPRVLLWGHSHGGNVLALMTNLLAADRPEREAFFHATRSFFRRWRRGKVDLPVWEQVRDLLDAPEHPLRRLQLDIVTFGTPVRYGWAAGGYANLLHFIHHCPHLDRPEYLAPYPLSLRRMWTAAAGDSIQQIGIAGSNFPPLPIFLRTLLADWRLDNFLEHGLVAERPLRRLSHACRVPDAGATLLVDYTPVEPRIYQHLAGHALYTRRRWLPFHCEQVVEHFYPTMLCDNL